MAASAAKIAEVLAGLRAASARLRTGAELERGRLSSGVPELDAALGGGWPRGRLIELVGARSSGRMSIVVGALAAAQERGELVALVDGADAFDPRSAAQAGVQLPRLLWVRPTEYVAALQAADRVLDAGGFGLVVAYLCGMNGRVRGENAWARLAQRAERARAAVIVVGERAQVGAFAAATLEARRGRAAWSGLFDGAPTTVTVVRSKLGVAGGRVELERKAG
jgi:RecA/RadA recombinase